MRKVPSLSDLEYFLTIVANGSFSSAAKELRVQQPTLSVAIQRLESIVGKTLLVRTSQGATTTREGQVFTGRAKQLVEKWKEISEYSSSVKIRERFSIGCHQSTGIYTLRRFLPGLLASHRELDVTIEHQYAHDSVEAVLRNRLDFAIAVNPIRHQDLEIADLYPTYVALWTSIISEKNNTDVLFFDPRMYSIETVLAQLEQSRADSFRKLPIGSLDTIASLIVAGAGRGILPADTACGQGGPLLKIFWEPKQIQPLVVSLVCRKDILSSPFARILKESIQDGLKGVVPGKKYRRPPSPGATVMSRTRESMA